MDLTEIRRFAYITAQEHGLRPELVWAIISVESGFKINAYRYEPAFWDRYLKDNPAYLGKNPRRVSASYGLMQIMFTTAEAHGFDSPYPEDLYAPERNIVLGCKILRRLMADGYGEASAICAYNGGIKGNRKAPFRNQAYLDKVRDHEAHLSARR